MHACTAAAYVPLIRVSLLHSVRIDSCSLYKNPVTGRLEKKTAVKKVHKLYQFLPSYSFLADLLAVTEHEYLGTTELEKSL